MSQLLKDGQLVDGYSSKLSYKIAGFLGGGGQGEVYRAECGGKMVALKWYFRESGTQMQRDALEMLVRKGAPTDRFLWPLELVDLPGSINFGYVMPLRGPEYKNTVDLMKRRIDPTFKVMAVVCRELAHSFYQLHAKGLCYRDINFNNVFFNPVDGKILICDNDNVTVDGQGNRGISGTPRFMAPEIVRGQAYPSIQTDRFSLAVLMFYLLMVHHPLEGALEHKIKSFDLPAMNRLYGTDPVFIFDPDNASNRPVPHFHDNALENWKIFPQYIQNLFTRSFTDGLKDPQNGRVGETEWRAAMVRLHDSVVSCHRCRAENFFDKDAFRADPTFRPTCWACRQEYGLPPRLRVGGHMVVLNSGSRIHAHHVDDERTFDFEAAAEVVQHPTDPNRWGLKNLTNGKWVYTAPGNQPRDVIPGQSAPLLNGATINFGKQIGEVCSA